MPGRSIFSEVAVELMDEARAMREEADASREIPFMQEKLRRRDALNRLRKMTPGERKEAREKMGDEGLLKLLKGGR